MAEAGADVSAPAAALDGRSRAASEGPSPPDAGQRAAIEDRGRDLFLSAGAGSGKTSVLVARFCDAVCATEGEDADVGIENVLAFTFTERAADELKRRIRSELARRAAACPDPGRERELRSLAREAGSAWVSTIHSFCRRVLASNPLAAGLDPDFRVLDEPAATRLATEAFEAAFASFGAEAGDERFELAAAYRLPALRELIRAAHDELRSRGLELPELPALAASDPSAASARLNAAAAAALRATEGARASGAFHDCRALIAEAEAATRGRRLPEEDEVARWAFGSSAKGLDVAEVAEYRDARAALERALVETRFADRYEHLRELLRLFAGEYARRKLARSALDFEDLQLAARGLLQRHPEVRRRYQRQFRHLLVDEFQDTNALQFAVVRLLHEEAGAGVNRLFTVGDELQSIYGFRHADLAVFRARRAEAEAAPDDRSAVARLGANFRSTPSVLALVNAIGRELFGSGYEPLTPAEAGGAEGHGAVELLVTERRGWDEEDAGGEVSADERAQPWRRAEARQLAERLRELAEEGVPRGDIVVLLRSFSYVEAYEQALADAGLAPYVVGGRGYWSKQQVADVRNLLACVANPLDDKALLGVLASPACGVRPDTLWLLRRAAGAAPLWLAVDRLLGPAAGGVPGSAGDPGAVGDPDAGERGDRPDDDAARWRRRVEEVGASIPADDAAALGELHASLVDVRAAAPRLSLEALIERVVTATGYDLALLMRPGGRRRMANVRKLMRLARDFEASEGRDLRGFLDFAAGEAEGGGREAEAAVDAEGHDGVRIMTVHAAKGLEFPVVAVADLGRSLSAGFPPALRLEPAEGGGEAPAMRVGLRLARLGRRQVGIYDYERLAELAAAREREEERRILHVAATRARRRLLLSGAFELERLGDDPKDPDPLIATILRGLRWNGRDERIPIPGPRRAERPDRPADRFDDRVEVAVRVRRPGQVERVQEQTAAGAAAHPPPPPNGEVIRPLPDPELADTAPPPGPPLRAVSYSALASFERCAYRFYVERVVGLGARPPAGGAAAHAAAAATGSGEDAPPAPEGDELHPPDDLDALATRYARGRVVHRLLERSARSGWSEPVRETVAELLAGEGVEPVAAQVSECARLVNAFLAAPIRGELERATLYAEAPFAFRAGQLVVRGEIDLLADRGDEVLVVDYKSDALRGSDPADHVGRYRVQCRIYALAALRRYARPVRVAYVFLERPEHPVVETFGPEDVGTLTDEIESLAEAVARGRFEVTDRPERPLCFDCPARERLCVHGPELTMRDSAA